MGLRLLAPVVTAVALAAGAAQAASAADPAVSPNWSGYVASSPAGTTLSYTSVTGTWNVPAATCSASRGAEVSVVSIGLGGYATTQKMEEVGTDANCDAKGKPLYYAWFELVPYPATTIKNTVQAGDAITGTVKILPPDHVQVQVQNQTRGWTFVRDINWTVPDTSSAEWLVVAPASCVRFLCGPSNLANFGSVAMRNVSAVANGATGNLASTDWAVTALQLVPGPEQVPFLGEDNGAIRPKLKARSPAGATPGSLLSDGSGFSVDWVAVANRGL